MKNQRSAVGPLGLGLLRRPAALIPILILATLAVIAALMATRPRPEVMPVEERSWRVESQTVTVSSHSPNLLLYGSVQSPSYLQITSALEADVLEVPVREGMTVAAGDLLVALDEREAQQRLSQRRAELAEIDALVNAEQTRHKNDLEAIEQEKLLAQLADRGVERARSLAKRDLLSSTALDEALQQKARQDLALLTRQHAINEHPARLAQLEARRRQAAARLSLAQLEVDRTRLIAPAPGKVTRTAVAAGKRVRVGDALVEFYPFSSLEVRAQIPSNQVGTVSRALEAGHPLSAAGRVDGADLSLELTRMGGYVTGGTGGVDGFFRVIAGEELLQIGRVVELLLTLPAVDDTFIVPHGALYGTDRIYRIVDGRLQTVAASVVGESRTLDAPVGLIMQAQRVATGDHILITKFANAMDGARVNEHAQAAERSP